MGHTGQSYTQPVAFVHHMDHVSSQPPPIDRGPLHPHTAPIIQPIAMQPLSGVYYSTQQQQQQEAGQVPAPHMHNSQPAVYRTYTPDICRAPAPPSNENLLISDLTSFHPPQTPSQQSSQEEVATTNCDSEAVKLKHQVHKGLPRANSYPRGMVHSIQQGNQFPGHGRSSMTTPPSQLLHMMSAGNRQQLRTQRALTPPATLGKRVSAPVFNFRPGSVNDRHSLPPGLSLCSLSIAPGCNEASQPSSATLQQPSELVVPTQPAGGNDTENTTNGLIYIPSNNTAVESEGRMRH